MRKVLCTLAFGILLAMFVLSARKTQVITADGNPAPICPNGQICKPF